MEDRYVQKDYKKLLDELILKEFDINNFHIQVLVKKEPKEYSDYLRQLIKNDYSIDNLREISNGKLSEDKPSQESSNQEDLLVKKFDFIPKSYEEVRNEIIQTFNNLSGNIILLKSRQGYSTFDFSLHDYIELRLYVENLIRQTYYQNILNSQQKAHISYLKDLVIKTSGVIEYLHSRPFKVKVASFLLGNLFQPKSSSDGTDFNYSSTELPSSLPNHRCGITCTISNRGNINDTVIVGYSDYRSGVNIIRTSDYSSIYLNSFFIKNDSELGNSFSSFKDFLKKENIKYELYTDLAIQEALEVNFTGQDVIEALTNLGYNVIVVTDNFSLSNPPSLKDVADKYLSFELTKSYEYLPSHLDDISLLKEDYKYQRQYHNNLSKSRYNSHKNSSRKFNHSNHNSRKVVRQFTRNVIRQSSHIKYSGRR